MDLHINLTMTKIKIILITTFIYLFKSITQVYAVPLGTIEGVGRWKDAGSNPTTATADIISIAIGFLTIVSGLFFLFAFIIGAMNWITSDGDPQKLDKARHKMTNAAIGLTIVIAAYSISYIIGAIVGIDFLNINTAINSISN